MTNLADPRAIAQGENRWITDSRVYNLVWLGRWVERAQTTARVVKWAAMQDASASGHEIEKVLRMAADIRGLEVGQDETALELLLTRDSGASLRGSLGAARFNATHVAPVEVLRLLGAAIEMMDGDTPIASADDVISLMNRVLPTLDELHSAIEEAWFHSTPLSEEEVYRRFVQQQQQQQRLL
jgi:hypothetical protein